MNNFFSISDIVSRKNFYQTLINIDAVAKKTEKMLGHGVGKYLVKEKMDVDTKSGTEFRIINYPTIKRNNGGTSKIFKKEINSLFSSGAK